jgi:hypothetical protein
MPWVHLTTAPDQTTAESWIELLAGEDCEVRLDPADAVSFLGVSSQACRLLVRAADRDRARAILEDLGLPIGE